MRGNYEYAAIDAATSGDNALVPALVGHRIRVVALMFVITGTAVTVRFESGAGGAALTWQMIPLQGTGFVLPFNPAGWFQTAVGAALNLELGGAQSVDGCLVYEYIPGPA